MLIFLLIWGRIFYVLPTFAQEESPTSAPAPTSVPSSIKPPSEPKSPSEAKPTSEVKTTSEPFSQISSMPTKAPEQTRAPLPTSNPSLEGSLGSSAILSTGSAADPKSTPTTTPAGGNSSNNQSLGQGNSGESSLSTQGGSIDDPLNQFTGPFSENFAQEVTKHTQEIVNKNLAELENKLEALSITGFNVADFNTLSGNVYTADAFATLNLLNKLNSNMSGLGGFQVFNIYDTYAGDIVFQMTDGDLSGSFADANATVSKNSVTGPGSGNVADVEKSFIVKEETGNDATLDNDIVLQAVSGENSTSGNTGGGEIKTGKATAIANVINMVNTNLNVNKWLIAVVNIFGKLAGNIILPQDTSNQVAENESNGLLNVENSTTGPESVNQASYQSDTTASFANENFSDIQTDMHVSANTGGNEASLNTLGGSIIAGNSDIAVTNSTIANNNTTEEEGTIWIVIVNHLGKWLGHIIGKPFGTNYASNSLPIESGTIGSSVNGSQVKNEATGPLSTNESTFENSYDSTFENTNNAKISNNFTATANSGNNQASYNTGPGSIYTGDAKAGLNVLNMVNNNVTAQKFVAVFVNIFDLFLGDIVTPDQNPEFSNWYDYYFDNYDTNRSEGGQQTKKDMANQDDEQVLDNTGDGINLGDPYAPFDSQLPDQTQRNITNQPIYSQENIVNQFTDNYFKVYKDVFKPAVNKVYYKRQELIQQSRVLSYSPSFYQGIFLSERFVKATERSLPAILLGGVKIKVTSSWLSILPITITIFYLRRRRKINLERYITNFLEIIL